jgi:hypothetical protein
MTATAPTMKSSFESNDLRKALKNLPPKVQEAILKKSMRAAMQPTRDDLRKAWLAASFRGKPPHRVAIADATRIDVRRGPPKSGQIVGRVGVDYKASSKARVWHLLEAGFRHFADRKVYANFKSKTQKDRYLAQVHAGRSEIFGERGLSRKKRVELLQMLYGEAKAANPSFVAERSGRAATRKATSTTAIAGRWISKKIIAANMSKMMEAVKDQALQAAEEALKGGHK